MLYSTHIMCGPNNLSTVNMPKKPVFSPPSTLRLPWSNEQGNFMQEHDSQKPRASQVRGSRSRIRHYKNIVKLWLHSFKEIFRKSEKNFSALMVWRYSVKRNGISHPRDCIAFSKVCVDVPTQLQTWTWFRPLNLEGELFCTRDMRELQWKFSR